MTSKQRAYLRSLANRIDTILQVGKGGINENLIKQVDDALEARELIKLHNLETSPYTAKEAMNELANATQSIPVASVGNRFVLYRESKNNKKIEL